MAMPSSTSTTFIAVALASAWLRKLEWAGSRCWMRMNAIPLFAGSALRSCVKASSPPAEAPMPTMGNDGLLVCAAGRGPPRRCVLDRDDFALDWPMVLRASRSKLERRPVDGPPHARWDPRSLPYAAGDRPVNAKLGSTVQGGQAGRRSDVTFHGTRA